MSKLQDLINRLCPNGVPFKSLGELGIFYGGLTGKSKEDFKEGNAKFITYMNIYTNPSLKIDVQDFVKVSDSEKQNRIKKGDILFTGSSETPNECGFTSVVTADVAEPIYLNSFCFGLRLNNPELFNLDFLKHLLRSVELRNQISKTASGVTRFNVSKARLSKVTIPIPPIEIQTEIAEILDRFAEYAAELQAELQARKEQYEYYRNLLLSFNPSASDDEPTLTTWGGHSYKIAWKPMGEIVKIMNGKDYKHIEKGGIPVYGSGGIMTYIDDYIYDGESVLLPRKGSIGKIYYVNNKFWTVDTIYWTKINQKIIKPKFLYYFLKTQNTERKAIKAGAVPSMTQEIYNKILIPIPPLELQEKIVAILDRFETLVNDLTQGLPAEIAAVREQYEYYRNKLLTFKQLA